MGAVQKNAMESSRVRMKKGQTEKLSLRVTTNVGDIHPHPKCLQGRGGGRAAGSREGKDLLAKTLEALIVMGQIPVPPGASIFSAAKWGQ